MKGCFSAVDVATRMEIRDLLSRFCHTLDHNNLVEWSALFRPDAVVIAPRFGVFRGREEISTIPKFVAEEGGGTWRHIFNSIIINNYDYNTYNVHAYCTVNDWSKRGTSVRSWDFSVNIIRKRTLQISRLEMRPVGEFCDSSKS